MAAEAFAWTGCGISKILWCGMGITKKTSGARVTKPTDATFCQFCHLLLAGISNCLPLLEPLLLPLIVPSGF